jgi:hypothetical protein
LNIESAPGEERARVFAKRVQLELFHWMVMGSPSTISRVRSWISSQSSGTVRLSARPVAIWLSERSSIDSLVEVEGEDQAGVVDGVYA